MDEKIKLLYVWMKIMNDKELSQLKYQNIMIIDMLRNEFIFRINDKIIKPNTNNVNQIKYRVEYQNKNYVRFNMTNKRHGNIISKNKLLQAKYVKNDLLDSEISSNNKNNTYLYIPNFNKILPYLQNINKDLPDNKKDLLDLFGISHFIDFTKLTNKIIDNIQ